jgi:hypothetical protein
VIYSFLFLIFLITKWISPFLTFSGQISNHLLIEKLFRPILVLANKFNNLFSYLLLFIFAIAPLYCPLNLLYCQMEWGTSSLESMWVCHKKDMSLKGWWVTPIFLLQSAFLHDPVTTNWSFPLRLSNDNLSRHLFSIFSFLSPTMALIVFGLASQSLCHFGVIVLPVALWRNY